MSLNVCFFLVTSGSKNPNVMISKNNISSLAKQVIKLAICPSNLTSFIFIIFLPSVKPL